MTAIFTAPFTARQTERDVVGRPRDARDAARAGPAEHPGARIRRLTAVVPPFQDSSIAAPSFLRLAKGALAFNRTYVQQAVCSPSRNSFMSGRRPDSTRVYNFKTSFRESGIDASGKPGSEWVALPQAFKQAGYLTVGMGKLYHPGHPNNNDCAHPEAAGGCPSWTTSFNTTAPANVTLENHGAHSVLTCAGAECDFRYVNPDAQIFFKENRTLVNGTTVEAQPACAALADDKSTDEWLADAAVTTLRAVAGASAPFFFGVGFQTPPFWQLPQRYQDAYADLPLPRAEARTAPKDAPDVAFYSCDAINSRTDVGGPYCDDASANPIGGGACRYVVPEDPMPDALMKYIRAGYAGGVTWTDSQVGRVLDELSALGLDDSTVTVMWADHGWAQGARDVLQDGELRAADARAADDPRAVAAADDKHATAALAELVDLYPHWPTSRASTSRRRRSRAAARAAAARRGGTAPPPRTRAASTRRWRASRRISARATCATRCSDEFTHMGYSMRTAEWRYTEGRGGPAPRPTGRARRGRALRPPRRRRRPFDNTSSRTSLLPASRRSRQAASYRTRRSADGARA